MRTLLILLLCAVTAAAEEDPDVEKAFPVPDYYKDQVTTAPLEGVTPLQGTFPNGTLPLHLGAWPKAADGRPAECWTNKALEDEGGCMGLTDIKATYNITLETAEGCAAQCEEEPLCPGYQFSENGCWMGSGDSCAKSRTDLKNFTAARFQSGEVSVLADTGALGIQIMNLKNVGTFGDASDTAGATLCKAFCYSILECQHWQWFSTNGSGAGCWYDQGITKTEMVDGTDYQKPPTAGFELVAGEFIQHFCPPEPTTPAPTTPPPTTTEAPPNLTWLWVLLGVIGAALLAGIAYYCLQKPPPKKRAVKPKPPAEPKMVPVTKTKMVPVTISATYAAPAQMSYPTTVSYAAPTTYAAPTSYAAPTYAAPATYAASTSFTAPYM